jgi:hypothetical protein
MTEIQKTEKQTNGKNNTQMAFFFTKRKKIEMEIFAFCVKTFEPTKI